MVPLSPYPWTLKKIVDGMWRGVFQSQPLSGLQLTTYALESWICETEPLYTMAGSAESSEGSEELHDYEIANLRNEDRPKSKNHINFTSDPNKYPPPSRSPSNYLSVLSQSPFLPFSHQNSLPTCNCSEIGKDWSKIQMATPIDDLSPSKDDIGKGELRVSLSPSSFPPISAHPHSPETPPLSFPSLSGPSAGVRSPRLPRGPFPHDEAPRLQERSLLPSPPLCGQPLRGLPCAGERERRQSSKGSELHILRRAIP